LNVGGPTYANIDAFASRCPGLTAEFLLSSSSGDSEECCGSDEEALFPEAASIVSKVLGQEADLDITKRVEFYWSMATEKAKSQRNYRGIDWERSCGNCAGEWDINGFHSPNWCSCAFGIQYCTYKIPSLICWWKLILPPFSEVHSLPSEPSVKQFETLVNDGILWCQLISVLDESNTAFEIFKNPPPYTNSTDKERYSMVNEWTQSSKSSHNPFPLMISTCAAILKSMHFENIIRKNAKDCTCTGWLRLVLRESTPTIGEFGRLPKEVRATILSLLVVLSTTYGIPRAPGSLIQWFNGCLL